MRRVGPRCARWQVGKLAGGGGWIRVSSFHGPGAAADGGGWIRVSSFHGPGVPVDG